MKTKEIIGKVTMLVEKSSLLGSELKKAPEGELVDDDAVSYTHLDVYKRQALYLRAC